MTHAIDQVLDKIARLPHDWHGAGTVQREVLEAIVRHTAGRPLTRSAETGSGKTTLLLSQLSADHTVFAVDGGGSISRVKESPLFNPAHTTFVTGPTQRTLPTHRFHGPHQLVLIDGPHGYPFPDLEYYFLYPTLETGGLLVIDDLKIPTIARMYDIVKCEAMFEPIEVIDGNTAFLRRTDAELIHPESDSWWLQGYNKPYYDEIMGVRRTS
jgi:hypothetical protein